MVIYVLQLIDKFTESRRFKKCLRTSVKEVVVLVFLAVMLVLFAVPIKAKEYEVPYFIDKSLQVFEYALLPMYSMVGIFVKVKCWEPRMWVVHLIQGCCRTVVNPLLVKLIFNLDTIPMYLKAPNGFVQLIAVDEIALFDWIYLFAGYWI